MNVLHVSLGLPPLRTGGLNRYCVELMEAQVESGENVSLLFPGRFIPGKVRLRKGDWHGVRTYELVNPLPVALTYGVAEPDAFVTPCQERDLFTRLLTDVAPDVVHVHSYMGIYREFFHAAKAQRIPMVFTTHDYYPICLRCTLIDAWGKSCVAGPSASSCSDCCRGGMSLRKSAVMQSGIYAHFKQSSLCNKLAGIVKRDMAAKSHSISDDVIEEKSIEDCQRLLDYNREIFELFDLVLPNSRMTEKIYRRAFPDTTYRLVQISHAGLAVESEHRKAADMNSGPLTIGYFGGRKEYKGYRTLLESSRILHDGGVRFDLRLYGDDYDDEVDVPEARSFGRLAYDEMNAALRELDVVVIPSLCYETFNFVVLEALCAGIPVFCSDAVGASELVDSGHVFHAGNAFELADKLKKSTSTPFSSASRIPKNYPLSMADQVAQLRGVYKFGLTNLG